MNREVTMALEEGGLLDISLHSLEVVDSSAVEDLDPPVKEEIAHIALVMRAVIIMVLLGSKRTKLPIATIVTPDTPGETVQGGELTPYLSLTL